MRTFKILALVALVCSLGLAFVAGTAQTSAADKAVKCPVSGKDATNSDVKFEYKINGKDVPLCCKGCADPFAKSLNLQKPEKLVCSISGKPANKEFLSVEKQIHKISLCCPGCAKPAAEKFHLKVADSKPGKCALSGKAASADHFIAYAGGKEFFCCPKCLEARVTQLAAVDKSEKCAISGKPAKAEFAQYVEVHTLKGYCCGKCMAADAKKSYKDGVYIGHIEAAAKKG